MMHLFRLLLHLYPTSFRHEYGADMSEIFARRLHDADGVVARAALWVSTLGDVFLNATLVHWDILRQDLRYTARTLRRAPGFAVTAVLVVALGIGATTAAFSVTDFALIRPLKELAVRTAMGAGRETASRAVQLRVLGAFAVIAFFLAGVGIHGVLSFAVSQRTQEIGVRIALGAQSRDILSMIVRRGVLLAVAGVVPGVALAYVAGRMMESLLVGVKPGDGVTFLTAVALAVAMTIAGCLLPTLRALRIDPIKAIRSE